MKKAVLSDKLYIKLTEEEVAKVRHRFTHAIFTRPGKPPRYMYRFGLVANETYWFPKNSQHILEEEGIVIEEIVDKRVSIPVVIPKPSFTLRPDQAKIVEAFEESGILNGKPSYGKTIAGLGLAYRLQQKTLIVCTTTIIRDMWKEEIERFFGFTPGIIGSGKFEIDSPIVVGNIQTLTRRLPQIASEFGLIIGDECHRTPASTFLDLFDRNKAKYFLGLSGTLKRKDGLQVVFPGIFGKDVFIPPEINRMAPTVHRFRTDIEFKSNPMIPWAVRVNDLTENRTYINFVQQLMRMYVALGHKVLVVGDRIDFLNTLYEGFEGEKYIITGQQEHSTLEYRNKVMEDVAKGPPCPLLASTSIFAEGVSLNELSAVIVTTPTNNESLIEQIAGRVQRVLEGKDECIYVDITLKGETAKRHSTERAGIYINNNWVVKEMTEQTIGELLKAKVDIDSKP